jgi:4-hydroxybenzoate polyprenyltransferase and related prenyltransferases
MALSSTEPGILKRIGMIGDSVMITHTLFSLPFVVAAILLETEGRPPAAKLLWIIVAAFGARNAANSLNRIIDRDIDAKNPRTAGRHLPLRQACASRAVAFHIRDARPCLCWAAADAQSNSVWHFCQLQAFCFSAIPTQSALPGSRTTGSEWPVLLQPWELF